MVLKYFNISKSAEISVRKHWLLGAYHSSCLKMLWFATQGPLQGESSHHPLKTKTCFATAAKSVGCYCSQRDSIYSNCAWPKEATLPTVNILSPILWHSHPMIKPLPQFGTTLKNYLVRVYDRKS